MSTQWAGGGSYGTSFSSGTNFGENNKLRGEIGADVWSVFSNCAINYERKKADLRSRKQLKIYRDRICGE